MDLKGRSQRSKEEYAKTQLIISRALVVSSISALLITPLALLFKGFTFGNILIFFNGPSVIFISIFALNFFIAERLHKSAMDLLDIIHNKK